MVTKKAGFFEFLEVFAYGLRQRKWDFDVKMHFLKVP